MKKATCRDMRGACDAEFQGETPEEMGQSCRQHVMEMVQSGDEAHKTAMDSMMKLGKEEQENGTRTSGVNSTLCRMLSTPSFGF